MKDQEIGWYTTKTTATLVEKGGEQAVKFLFPSCLSKERLLIFMSVGLRALHRAETELEMMSDEEVATETKRRSDTIAFDRVT